MKKINSSLFLILSLSFLGCIGEDVIDDAVEPVVRILNPVNSIAVFETYQFNATYFNNVGQPESTSIAWSSSNEAVATINNSGLVTGVSEGETTIKAAVTQNNTVIEDVATITVIMSSGQQTIITKSGIVASTSGYDLSGNFTLSEIENSNNLLLSLDSNYNASSNLPGLYVYLTNNPNSVANAYEIGPVTVFQGAHTYTINNIGINDYSYLLYWCKPFGVKVGGGDINN